MILYLMSKYTGREAESLKENQDAWLALNEKGYIVYSPICESHNIEEYRQELEQESPNNLLAKPIDYVARDLRVINNFKQVVGVVLPSAYHYPNSTSTYNIELGFIWDSKGAKAEYDFCKAHHILVISLETALTVPREQWEMHNL
jgi:hypothetical protein